MITVNEMPSVGNFLGQQAVHGMEHGREQRITERALKDLLHDDAMARTISLMAPGMRAQVLPGIMEQRSGINFLNALRSGQVQPNGIPQGIMSNDLQNRSQQPAELAGQPGMPNVPQGQPGMQSTIPGLSLLDQLAMGAPKSAQGILSAASAAEKAQGFRSAEAEENRKFREAEAEKTRQFHTEEAEKQRQAAEHKLASTEQKDIRKTLLKEEIDFDKQNSGERKINQKILNEANAMKTIVEENKNLFGAIRGATSLGNLKKLERNPKLREFDRRQADLIVKLSGAQPGASRATDMLRKLIQEGKIDRTQPYDTILAGLKQIVEEASIPEREAKAKDRLKKKFGNQLPEDFRTQVSDIVASEENPLGYPQWFKENTVYEDDNGQKHVLKNGEWKDL